MGDIQVFLDLYNVEDSDPLNPVLPNGVYEAGSEYAPFTYNPSYSYVDIVVEDMGDGNYKFTFDLVDDGGNKITGDWTGVVNVDDLSDEIAGGDTASVQRLSVATR
ncbi:MAG: hypothetical protein J6Q95_08235 [Alistipes sp.]|nr:hypothetical protein [Alistipes sp.]